MSKRRDAGRKVATANPRPRVKAAGRKPSVGSPVAERNRSDPGDDTNRRDRYQFAYGVILLIGSATRQLDYRAVWCEQHEDFLAEVSDTVFDAYQVKTRKPESGAWKLSDEDIWKSIKRFVELDRSYPGKIRKFNFVSNVDFSASAAKQSKHLSPVKLLATLVRAARWKDLSGEAKKGFEILLSKTGAKQTELFRTLKRLHLVSGPGLQSFEAELAQDHIPKLPDCATLNSTALRRVRESLIQRIAQASSLVSDDPARHYAALNGNPIKDPLLLAKRVSIEDLTLVVRDARGPAFNYLASLASLQLGSAGERLDVMREKMNRGGLGLQYEAMRRKALSAEQSLLDIATRPDNGVQVCSQIESVVLTQCSDAWLRASQDREPFGPRMLIDVQDRLKEISERESRTVHHQPPDLLEGVAGLLTSECKVWWSQQFTLASAQ